jgi:hypothetical protein
MAAFTSHTSNLATSSGCHGQLSAGVVAGAIVGTAIGAALITASLCLYLLKTRSNRSGIRVPELPTIKKPPRTDVTSVEPRETTISTTLYAYPWERYLSNLADDPTIRSSVGVLFYKIELHVYNIYEYTSVAMTEELKAKVLKTASPCPDDSLKLLLDKGGRGVPIVKRSLAQLIVSRISLDGDYGNTFIPLRSRLRPKGSPHNKMSKQGK